MAHDLETRLDYRFETQELLRRALTHASTAGRRRGRTHLPPKVTTNQRLEFLGDRVLALVVAQLLLERYPESAEGPLTSRSQVLVSTATLAEIADELELARWLVVDPSAGKSGGLSAKMRADVCEALIGAIFADGGLEAATAFIRRHWRARIEAMAAPPRDPKMALQEWALERGLPLPVYRLTASDGPPHAPSFQVEAAIVGRAPVVGAGSSKRRAEQAAARTLLEGLPTP